VIVGESQGLVENVVFGEEFFEFGLVNAADDAF
jgi:hypothetical protein